MGSTVVVVTASDPDSSDTSDGQIAFSFNTPQSLFTIDSSTGVVSLAAPLDR